MTQAPRPYVVYLNQNTLPFMGYKANSFYRLPETFKPKPFKKVSHHHLRNICLQQKEAFPFRLGIRFCGIVVIVVCWAFTALEQKCLAAHFNDLGGGSIIQSREIGYALSD